jgi:hypothetical protein
VLAVVAVVVLAATGVWNPFPAVWDRITSSEPLAGAAASWQQKLGGTARSVTVTGGAVVVEYRTRIEAFGVAAGVQLWEKNADWSAVAGRDGDSVVVVGELLTKGYQVLDPGNGQVRRKDTEAVAVWTYDDALLDVRCAKARDCELSAWDPRGTRPLWTVTTPGIGFVLSADNPDLPDTRPLPAGRISDRAGGPTGMPGLIGFPADGKLHVVDTAAGRVVQVLDADRERRVAVAGGRLLTVTADGRDGTCYFTVDATDPSTGRQVWQREGLNLRTAGDGAGCRQEQDPAGGYDVVLGVDPVGREVLVDSHDGRTLWRGGRRQRVLAVDDRHAVIRAADGRTLSGRAFGPDRAVWERRAGDKAEASLTPWAAIVVDPGPGRVTALSPRTGAVLAEARTEARVLAVGSGGMILGAGRDMAYVPFTVNRT